MNGSLCHEPPLYHAQLSISPDRRTYTYTYNNLLVLTVALDAEQTLAYRLVSDGDMLSTPFHQQAFLTSPIDLDATVTIRCTGDGQVMRPSRADGCAILGQIGGPLIDGVNGFYDLGQDLLISWHGRPWRWLASQACREQGHTSATFQVQLGPEPWILHWRMQYYRMHLGFASHRPWQWRPNQAALAGWCSWEAYHRDVSLEKIACDAAFLADQFKSYGLGILQIDDGYQPLPQPEDDGGSYASAFMQTNSRFPGGHPALVDVIRKSGLEPGIWVNVSISNQQFARASGHIVKNEAGEPLLFDWLGYCLDMTPACLADEIKPLYLSLRQAGYTYVKVDSLRHLLYDAFRCMVSQGMMSNDEANSRMEQLFITIREALGDDVYLLACWGALSETIGTADACRIATDANPGWKAVRMQLFETARWYGAQRILFTLDPDHLCIRTHLPWAKSLLSLASLSGCLIMLSDRTEDYDTDRISLIRRTLPPLAMTTAETGPVDYMMPAWPLDHHLESRPAVAGFPFASLWCWHLRQTGLAWAVMLRVAIDPLLPETLALEQLGLDPGKTYLAFDFWSQTSPGLVSTRIDLPALALGDCQAISFREAANRPQFAATDRHVSMDAITLDQETWHADSSCLSLDLRGFPGLDLVLWIYLPSEYRIRTASCISRNCKSTDAGMTADTRSGADQPLLLHTGPLIPLPGTSGHLAGISLTFQADAATLAIETEASS